MKMQGFRPFILFSYGRRIPLLAFSGMLVVMVAGNVAALGYGLLALGLLATVVFLPRAVRRLRGGEAPGWIEGDELARRLEESSGVAVVDVRRPEEFNGPLGHIANARNVPVIELPQRLRELDALKEHSVVLVCRTDRRSASAAALLRDAGFGDVRVLRGGMVQWNQNGRPVEDRAPPLQR
jgi:rhodanese-related sulfurtransferase